MTLHILTDSNGQFSWRKMYSLVACIVIVVSMLGNQFFGWKPLPSEYIGLLVLIIGFYFFRRRVDSVQSKKS